MSKKSFILQVESFLFFLALFVRCLRRCACALSRQKQSKCCHFFWQLAGLFLAPSKKKHKAKTKKKELYVLVGNYLQSLNWHNNAEYTRTIIQFYNGAKAYIPLAYFYDAYAQIEIEEYRDYEKATRLFKQAVKVAKKDGSEEREEKMAEFSKKFELTQMFVNAKKLASVDGKENEMVSICEAMIARDDLEMAVKLGDVFALLIEVFHSKKKYNEAYSTIERMKEAQIDLFVVFFSLYFFPSPFHFSF